MKIGFVQCAVHCMHGMIGADFWTSLPNSITQHTGIDYSCVKTGEGCILRPTLRKMPYRNSFVPEIVVEVSQNKEQTTLCLTGKPVMAVRVFMWMWFSFFLVIGAAFLFAGRMDRIVFVFLPAIFGYFLFKIATKVTFQVVLRSIQREYP